VSANGGLEEVEESEMQFAAKFEVPNIQPQASNAWRELHFWSFCPARPPVYFGAYQNYTFYTYYVNGGMSEIMIFLLWNILQDLVRCPLVHLPKLPGGVADAVTASLSPGDEADIYVYTSTWARLLNSTLNHLDFQGSKVLPVFTDEAHEITSTTKTA
jgi:hypothetical protein